MHQAAKDAHLPSERMSFTATVMLCQTYASSFLDARTHARTTTQPLPKVRRSHGANQIASKKTNPRLSPRR